MYVCMYMHPNLNRSIIPHCMKYDVCKKIRRRTALLHDDKICREFARTRQMRFHTRTMQNKNKGFTVEDKMIIS